MVSGTRGPGRGMASINCVLAEIALFIGRHIFRDIKATGGAAETREYGKLLASPDSTSIFSDPRLDVYVWGRAGLLRDENYPQIESNSCPQTRGSSSHARISHSHAHTYRHTRTHIQLSKMGALRCMIWRPLSRRACEKGVAAVRVGSEMVATQFGRVIKRQ